MCRYSTVCLKLQRTTCMYLSVLYLLVLYGFVLTVYCNYGAFFLMGTVLRKSKETVAKSLAFIFNWEFLYLVHIVRIDVHYWTAIHSLALGLRHPAWPSTAWQTVSVWMVQKQDVRCTTMSSQFALLWGLKVFKRIQNNSFYTYTVATHHKHFIWPLQKTHKWMQWCATPKTSHNTQFKIELAVNVREPFVKAMHTLEGNDPRNATKS